MLRVVRITINGDAVLNLGSVPISDVGGIMVNSQPMPNGNFYYLFIIFLNFRISGNTNELVFSILPPIDNYRVNGSNVVHFVNFLGALLFGVQVNLNFCRSKVKVQREVVFSNSYAYYCCDSEGVKPYANCLRRSEGCLGLDSIPSCNFRDSVINDENSAKMQTGVVCLDAKISPCVPGLVSLATVGYCDV